MSDPVDVNKDTDAFIKKELTKFIFQHTGQDALSAIDEIVLSYMVSILEFLGSSDTPEDAFDVDEFAEMMSAYIPAFTNINSADICEWMFQLAEWLKRTMKENEKKKLSLEESFIAQRTASISSSYESSVLSSSPCSSQGSSRSRSTSQSEDEDRNPNLMRNTTIVNQDLDLLTEMFPFMCVMEVQQCLSMVNGDCEKAVQLILQRQDCGQQFSSLSTSNFSKRSSKGSNENVLRDKKLRDQILNRYAYIDQDDDVREHKPVAPKAEPRKLIRYRDNKIVSVKGERYTEIKTEDGETLKKNGVSLKPSRQFRFN